jgi:hypothetical protein
MMKHISPIYFCAAVLAGVTLSPHSYLLAADRAADTVILDESGMRNLRITTEVVDLRDFEKTVSPLGGSRKCLPGTPSSQPVWLGGSKQLIFSRVIM